MLPHLTPRRPFTAFEHLQPKDILIELDRRLHIIRLNPHMVDAIDMHCHLGTPLDWLH